MGKAIKKEGPTKYKAVNPSQFKEWYSKDVPYYKELSSGESVVVDLKSPCVRDWLDNKIIVKE
jgi:hypothetical protein